MINSLMLAARVRLVKARYKLAAWKTSVPYRVRHWCFQWKQDDEGDITFVLFNLIAFVKYKEHTIIKFNGYKLRDAGKWQGCAQD